MHVAAVENFRRIIRTAQRTHSDTLITQRYNTHTLTHNLHKRFLLVCIRIEISNSPREAENG